MGDASYAVPGFLGGEISKFAQGRFDRPDYRISLNVCFNALPVEIGPWVRRPGSMFAGTTRRGLPGRIIKFDFEQSTAVTMEFTDQWARFRVGPSLIGTNDDATVLAVSTANPAVLQIAAAADWQTGDTLVFDSPGPAPLLENREFVVTAVDSTHFSLADGLTGVAIDGATLGTITAGSTVRRVQELTTPYAGGSWAQLRAVQAETTDILLAPKTQTQALTVPTLPDVGVQPQFQISPANFIDGPYLDPFETGVQVAPSAKSGIISLTLSFQAYDSTKAYAKGAFVTSSGSGISYESLQDQNAGNAPGASPTWWQPISPAAAINNGAGFLGSDVGRSVRLFSEPPFWSATATYNDGTVVSYNPSGATGQTTYWQAIGTSTGEPPGNDLSHWKLVAQNPAVWTWGRITSLSSIIDRALPGSSNFGTMTEAGGVNAPFNGAFTQPGINSSRRSVSGGTLAGGSTVAVVGYVGKNYSSASAQKIASVTVYPPSDDTFTLGNYVGAISGINYNFATTVVLKLRAKHSAPTFGDDGVLLGLTSFANSSSAITIKSNDQTTAWEYVWVEIVVSAVTEVAASAYGMSAYIGQISFFGPPGTGSGTGVDIEILGAPLLYTNTIVTWRLGTYSDTTGWPTCGAYHEGRLWLGGAVKNRFDGSVSNGIDGSTINFAPTDQYGVVAPSNAISYTLNSDSVNPILWMQPDLQGLILGTQAGEWILQAPTTGPMAPNNIAGRRVTKIGCANVEPRRTENTTVFVQRYGRKLMEYFADVYSGKFSAPNIADRAEHVVTAGIAEIGYQSATAPVIWGRDTAGALFGVTYKRDTLTTSQGPTYAGWHRHGLGSGRLVESLCVGPSVGGDLDSLTMVTNDPVSNVRHVEILTDVPHENEALADAWYLDDAVIPSSTVLSVEPVTNAPYGGMTLNGLWHLNGATVSVFAGGLDCGTFQVSNGSCYVPFGDGVTGGTGSGLFTSEFVGTGIRFVVGFAYNSDGQLVRPITPADTGARNGPALGKTRRNHRYAMLLNNTKGISIGADFDTLLPVKLAKKDGETAIATLDTYSGVVSDTIDGDYDYDGMVAWRASGPYPANVIALEPFLQTQDR